MGHALHSDRFDQARVIILNVSDPRADGPGDHLGRRVRGSFDDLVGAAQDRLRHRERGRAQRRDLALLRRCETREGFRGAAGSRRPEACSRSGRMSRNRVWRRGCTVPHERWCVSDRLRSRRRDTDLARIVPLLHSRATAHCAMPADRQFLTNGATFF